MGVRRATTEARAFGKYTLVAKLAKGGMAEILLARLQGAAGFEKLVCIKRILPHLAEDEQFIAMFLAEARIAAMISHPNVCQVFELGELDGSYFIAMEYLEGVPLASLRRKDMYLLAPDPQLVVGIGIQACEGLHHAHQLTRADGSSLDVVHRDVSGQNLFVTTSGIVKVLDFGIAKIQDASNRTTTGAVKGTYAYMAPEQLRGQTIDCRADVFAMGTIMWETLAQRHLFKRDTDFLTFQAITTDPIPDVRTVRPDTPAALSDAINRALARDQDDRFPSARAFGEAMTRAVAHLGGPAGPAVISEEIARAFTAKLREQRALVRIAREGGALDLHEDQGPSLGHGTEGVTTPAPDQSASEPGAHTEILIPRGPRSETLSVAPLPPELPIAPRTSRRRWTVIVLTAIVSGLLVGTVVYVGSRSSAPTRAEPPGKSISASAIDAQIADATVAAVADAAPVTVVIADAAPSRDAAAIVALADAALPDAAIPVASSTPGPRPTPRPRPPDKIPLGPGPIAQAAAKGFLTIDSTPVYALIVIDGKPYGETPLFNIELAPGKHTLRAISPSKVTRSMTLTIESGKVAVRRLEW